ncbi:larval cuticle protein A1A-like [Amphibalanus amphitrite]|uniref:larval cuticle protein A1A-like n=1 Tax=Amphibalanus amphitrite TaxID=1232801 RepID=UPI001C8FBE4C|nr:larval cuticle protein A1A-like [Amphibalanus amphitrite]
MALKVVAALSALAALAAGRPEHGYGAVVVGEAPVARSLEVVDYVNPHPRYDFNYGVSDPYSGDHKSHVESRDGGVVRGQYRLVDADGTERVVTYTADDINGFQATVEKLPLTQVGVPAQHGGARVYSPVPAAVSHQQVSKAEGPDVPVVRERVHTAPVVAKVPAPAPAPAPVPAYQYAAAAVPAVSAPAVSSYGYQAPADTYRSGHGSVAVSSYGYQAPADTYRSGYPVYQQPAYIYNY